jgi:trimethylamine--corrinoid protein Co-methyltransferase
MTRRSHRERRRAGSLHQLPWRQVRNPYPPLEPLTAEQLEAIVDGALEILESYGMRVLEAECRRLLRAAGAAVDEATMMVRMERGLVLGKLALAPAAFDLRARNPQRNLRIGEDHVVFGAVGGPAFVSDLDRGRRPGTYAEQCDYIRLVQSLEIIHQEGGGPFEAMDLPPESRHLDLYLAQLTLTDKNCQGFVLGRERTRDCIAMHTIALGLNEDELAKEPAVLGVVNTNSPLQLDIPMGEAVLELAGAGQVTCITPFTLAGSMSPATLAGTLVQQTAEVLAVAVLAQCVRPGAPVMYGSFASNVDMLSGAPALGTPEYSKAAMASGQIARRLGLPLRSSNTTSSNCVDAQAAYESGMSLWGAVLGHAHLIYHAGGWLENGLTASFEKLIVDAEMLQMMAEMLAPIPVDSDTLALDAIRAVPPGGHHFGTSHTLSRYESAFYQPLLSSRDNFERWQEAGAPDAARRANSIWKKLLAEYEAPPLDPGIAEALHDFAARRKREIGRSA